MKYITLFFCTLVAPLSYSQTHCLQSLRDGTFPKKFGSDLIRTKLPDSKGVEVDAASLASAYTSVDQVTLKNRHQDLFKLLNGYARFTNISVHNLNTDTNNSLQEDLGMSLRYLSYLCRRDLENELYEKIIDYFVEKAKVQNQQDYDVIIVGAGISGVAAALALGPGHKILVLDKNQRWPSVFGSAGSFFLNANANYGRKNSITGPLPRDYVKLNAKDTKIETISARNTGKELLIDLFYSGADVLLNTPVIKIDRATSVPESPRYRVRSADGKTFFSGHVIVATGFNGINLSHFSQDAQALLKMEIEQKAGNIWTIDAFLTNLTQHPYQNNSIFLGKTVGVIGGKEGATAAVMGLLGYTPDYIFNMETVEYRTNWLTSLLMLGLLKTPLSIEWIGKSGLPVNSTKPDAILPNIVSALNSVTPGIVSFHDQKALSVTPLGDNKYQIGTENSNVIVDKIILATGYTSYLESLIPDAAIRQKIEINAQAIPTFKNSSTGHEFTDITVIGTATINNLKENKLRTKYIAVVDEEGTIIGSKIKTALLENTLQKQFKLLERLMYIKNLVTP